MYNVQCTVIHYSFIIQNNINIITLLLEDRGIIKSHLLTLSYQLISVALQRGIATHISIAAGRVNALHARSLAPFKSRGLSACGVQQILGLHDRNLLFGSQIPV